MNQGKIIIAVFILLGILGGLGGWWWNYWISHRAMEFWGQENARLVRLAPKVEYLELELKYDDLEITPQTLRPLEPKTSYAILKIIDISQARGLIHLRNAILSDDQYQWDQFAEQLAEKVKALRFSDKAGKHTTIYFSVRPNIPAAFPNITTQNENVVLGPLAKSLEQFLARELPRAEQEAAAKPNDTQPAPAKSE